MNARLLVYLRSLGLSPEADDNAAWEFYRSLRGLQGSIASALNYAESDVQARTNCDLMLRSLGVDPTDPSQMLPAETPPADDPQPIDADAIRFQAVAAERQRVADIRELAEVAQTPSDVLQPLLDSADTTVESARQTILEDHRARTRASVPADAPAMHTRNSVSENDRDSLLACFLLRDFSDPLAQWPLVDASTNTVRFSNQSNNPAIARAVDRGHEMRGLSMIEICRRALALEGIRAEPTLVSIEAAFVNAQRQGVSTGALTGIFTTSMNAQLLDAYEGAPDSTAGWTREVDVADYKMNERPRMEKGAKPVKRGRGGTAEHTTYTEALETYKVFEYAQQFVIDRQDLINDTFGALQEHSPREMGEATAELKADLVYSILLANDVMRDGTPLFDVSHGNLYVTAPLDVANLEAARAGMRVQQESDRNLNLMATHLIVPAALESTAEQLLESNVLITGSDILRGEINTNARAGITPVVDARLDNGVIDPATDTLHAGSQTKWFLAAARGHTIEVGYIRQLGRSPQVRGFNLDKGQFGIGFDVSLSVGAKALDWRSFNQSDA